ncbi:cell division protein ZipA C-terminal FtsZ-binding domain-containing protein [Methylococcus sp. EFPC2]|uniref:cell division protein ZipA C-terminal FtsZ-binding domain-containing protein n=1 Tax=Methylococcus sp. EFPC2 TaxID=2812648 RepID=UPI00196707E2|nr:cell division protein ZipA C-terminal FtsZ-binding domain-containing protein [Methylococcus sp. EFPC2]QSA95713.1 cell division protein ZipA C-terminal FtsZ-binding domain-containing protein [Methylococcus sp. EFPC2]
MDRDTVRIILLILGVLAIAGVYVWGRYKDKLLDFLHRRGEFDELGYDLDEDTQDDAESEAESSYEPIRFDGLPAEPDRPAMAPGDADEDESEFAPESEPSRQVAHGHGRTASLGAPFLIQLSVVAGDDGYFDGAELRDALVELDLIYGDMGIYHRYDREYREPLFSVASLVEPGTFPIDDMENFECPGVVLFFQPPQVSDALEVFDDLVQTCHSLALKLGGVQWDENRQPLTVEKVERMRQRLELAY